MSDVTVPRELFAVHAQGPDELYPAFSREDAEQHAAALNALPVPAGINVSAVVVPSPWGAAEHWQYLAEQEREHLREVQARIAAAKPASVVDERTAFELWAWSSEHPPFGWLGESYFVRSGDSYSDSFSHGLWSGWQARAKISGKLQEKKKPLD